MSHALKKVSGASAKGAQTRFWLIAKERTMRGPFTQAQLEDLVETGNIEPGHYCWTKGFSEWRPLCSVPEFGLDSKPFVVQAYPQIAPPSSAPRRLRGRKHSGKKSVLAKPWEGHESKEPVRVRLQKQATWGVSHWERLGMVIFAIAFAWLSTHVAVSSVQEGFEYRYQQTLVGEPVTVVDPRIDMQSAWHLAWVEPLKTAPALKTTPISIEVPVRLVTQRLVSSPEQAAHGKWVYRDHALAWSSPHEFRGVQFQHKTDPIYFQPYELFGTWTPNRETHLKMRTPGYPGL